MNKHLLEDALSSSSSSSSLSELYVKD